MILMKLVACASAAVLMTGAAVFIQPDNTSGESMSFSLTEEKASHSNLAMMTESERSAYIRQQLATANARFP